MSTAPLDPFETLARPEAPPPGAPLPQVPGYEVLELIGRGGVGRVYKARHLGLGRVVALKMLASAADGDLLARFRTEVLAVAGLQHPHIAQVFEAGRAGGEPFYTLEYLEGGSLAQRLGGRPQAPREAAALVETVARAVHYSHERGILHRDLKPANVLLAADGSPKVADFGLAKRLAEDSRLTRTGEVVGTPSYMAPEQASGVVAGLGPAVDVYALGAILYEMLTGRPPFQGPTPLDTVLQVMSMDPVSPRALQPGVPRDLETVCLKSLDKSPRKRYRSAADLADDLRRFLDGRPIIARPVRPWERALKWARRRPAVALLLAVSAAAVVALAVSYFQVRSALHEAREANEQKDLALAEADGNLLVAQGAVERMLVDTADRLATIPQAEPVRRDLMTDAQGFYEKLKEVRPRNPANRFLAAAARRGLGDIDRMSGRTAEAEASYRLARDAFAELAREQPDNAEFRLALVGACNGLGNLHLALDDPAAAEADFRQALAEADRLGDGAANAEALRTVGRVRNNLAIVLAKTGRPEEAEKEHRDNLATRRRRLELSPDDAEAKTDLAVSHNNLGKLLAGRQQFAEAADEFGRAEELLAGAGGAPEARFFLGQVQGNRAGLLAVLKRPEEAEKEYAAAVATLSPLAAGPASAPAYRYHLGETYVKWGAFLGLGGKEADARERVRSAEAIFQALAREFPENTAYRESLRRCAVLLGTTP